MRYTNRGKKIHTHTCNGVWIEVPGLFSHVEESRDKSFCPRWQFTENQKRKKEESQSQSEGLEEQQRDYGRRQRDPKCVCFLPFIARIPVGYFYHSIHLYDSFSFTPVVMKCYCSV